MPKRMRILLRTWNCSHWSRSSRHEKKNTKILQAQLKALSTVERMKRSQEQQTIQQQVHMIQRKFMEVTQWLQPVQDKAYQLFTDVER
jgi:hypothetical protein